MRSCIALHCLLYGLAKRDALGVGSILISAALLDRGITGQSVFSSIFGRYVQDHSGTAKQRSEATYAITIDAPAEKIERRLGNPESLRQITSGGRIPEFPGDAGSGTAKRSRKQLRCESPQARRS
jgi:hypothetical protein